MAKKGEKEWTPRPEGAWTFEDLVRAFANPPFNRYAYVWEFWFDIPEVFSYSHMTRPVDVYFTPDWTEYGLLDIEVMHREEGRSLEVAGPFRFREDRRPETLFELVKPYLDKYRYWE